MSPFLIGCYIGKKKPEDINDFLFDFVQEFLVLQERGIELGCSTVFIKLRAIICDAPARAFVSGTVGHTSASGCSKCTQQAMQKSECSNCTQQTLQKKKRLTYSVTVESLRTDDDFRARRDPQFHLKMFIHNEHILEKLNVRMISQFPLDVMHLIDLGVVRKMLLLIWNDKLCSGKIQKISRERKQDMDNFFLSLRNCIPKEFQRKPRSFNELCRWKATEFRLVVLYVGPVLFKNFLCDTLYTHFLLLHSSYRLISSTKCRANLDCVQSMLEVFVHNFQYIYCENKVSYNVHNLLHIASCVQLFGNVNSFSAYKYENYLQVLKKDCRKPNFILQQICNRINERNEVSIKNRIGMGKKIVSHRFAYSNSPLYTSYNFNEFFLSIDAPDCYCYFKPFVPIKICGFFKDKAGREYIVGRVFLNKSSFFTEPVHSMSSLGIAYVSNLSDNEEIFAITNLISKCIFLPIGDRAVIVPILHYF